MKYTILQDKIIPHNNDAKENSSQRNATTMMATKNLGPQQVQHTRERHTRSSNGSQNTQLTMTTTIRKLWHTWGE